MSQGPSSRFRQGQGVDILLPGQPTRRGRLLDLSPTSARLEAATLPLGLSQGQRLRLGLRLPPDAGDGYFRVRVQITQFDRDGVQVRFLDPDPRFDAALAAHLGTQDSRQAQLAQRARAQAERLARIDAASQEGAGVPAARLLEQLLVGAAASLEEQVEQARSDAERTRIRDDAALLRLACRRGLPQGLAARVLTLRPGRQAPAPVILFDDERTDLWLATRRLQEHLEPLLAEPLQRLTWRLMDLEVGAVQPPCAPATLAAALETALTELDLSLEGRLLALNRAQDLAGPLQDLYRALLWAWEDLPGPDPSRWLVVE